MIPWLNLEAVAKDLDMKALEILTQFADEIKKFLTLWTQLISFPSSSMHELLQLSTETYNSRQVMICNSSSIIPIELN